MRIIERLILKEIILTEIKRSLFEAGPPPSIDTPPAPPKGEEDPLNTSENPEMMPPDMAPSGDSEAPEMNPGENPFIGAPDESTEESPPSEEDAQKAEEEELKNLPPEEQIMKELETIAEKNKSPLELLKAAKSLIQDHYTSFSDAEPVFRKLIETDKPHFRELAKRLKLFIFTK